MMFEALHEVNGIVRFIRTTTKVEMTEILEIMVMDQSGEGKIDVNEYTMFMLKSTGQVDMDIISAIELQFHALDVTNDGHLCEEDFPEGMGLKKTSRTFKGDTTTDISVVHLDANGKEDEQKTTAAHCSKQRLTNN